MSGVRAEYSTRDSSAQFSSSASMPSHNVKPGRRRQFHLTLSQLVPLVLLVLTTLCGISEARSVERRKFGGALEGGKADVDGGHVAHGDRHERELLAPRDDPLAAASSSSTIKEKTHDKTAAATPTTTPTSTSTSAAASSTSSPKSTKTKLPRVFDTSLGNNFTTSSCPTFFQVFINSPDFNACLPFSLLLPESNAFFRASDSPSSLSTILDATCSVDFNKCSTLMSSYASQIRRSDNCGADYDLGNPLVTTALKGFIAYTPMYQAGCLKASGSAGSSSSTDDEYCYVSAVAAAADDPSDSYIYSLPLGMPLPGAGRPTCSPCVKKTMGFFATAAQNLSTPLSTVYSAAALQVNQACGPHWVNSSVTPIKGSAEKNSASPVARVGLNSMLVAALAMGVWLV